MVNEELCKQIIEKFDDLDSGSRVQFKRSCGKMLHEVEADTMMLFYMITTGKLAEWEENRIFTALCIHALWGTEQTDRISMDEAILNYEETENQEVTQSFNARIAKIMDLEWDDDGFLAEKLVRMAKLLKQKGYPIDGTRLMRDLIHWNDYNRKVQKRWARTLSGIREEK